MFGRDSNDCLGTLLSQLPFLAVVVNIASKNQDKTQTEGMRELVGKGKPLRDLLERLLGIPEKTEVPRYPDATRHSRVKPIGIGQSAVFLGIVQGRPLLEDLIPLDKVSHYTEGPPQRIVRRHQLRHVLRLLGQGKEVVGLCQSSLAIAS